ncbi:MAG: glycogen/starch synthase [Nanoarchaeota archaeon]|nr:glycogen/starch synthase [Nanoarchaeota archaeon]
MKPKHVFECSWEVCNKVGGIFTVVKSKAALMVEHYGDGYFMVGPYFADKVHGEFMEEVPSPVFKAVFEELAKEGIMCHFGKWLVEGEPKIILIDFTNFTYEANAIKARLWQEFRIDSMGTQFHDFDEPIIWSTAVGKLLEKLGEKLEGPIVGHFHEWLAAGGLLYLKDSKKVATVFTTHATMLGRTLASHDVDIYNELDKLDPDAEAYRLGIQSKYLTEKSAAMCADQFTTVSEITGMEAEALLKRKPDILLPNGLDMSKFPTFEDISIKHKLLKSKMLDFIIYYFFPYYHFDLDKTRIFFLAGRYEYHDKGIDVFIDALGNVNRMLKEEKSDKTIVTFIWVPGAIRGIKTELLENKMKYQDVLDTFNDNLVDIKNRLVFLTITDQSLCNEDLFDKDITQELKRKLLSMKRKEGSPPLSTHNLVDEQHDDVMCGFRRAELLNREEDRVKVVFYGIYLTGADGLLDTNYYESMLGSHLGVFPSFYEPWGYTPLEAGALGISSVTTDLAGFGRYLSKLKSNKKMKEGIFVLPRFKRSYDQIVKELTGFLYDYVKLDKAGRIKNKLEARRLASMADWKNLISNYFEAHEKAVQLRFKDGAA